MKTLLLLFCGLSALGLLAQDTIHLSPNLMLVQVSERAYVHVSYYALPRWGRFPSNGLVVVDADSAFLFDTPMSDSLTDRLLDHLTQDMGVRLVGFVPNHWHNDCTEGMDRIHARYIPTLAHMPTNVALDTRDLPLAKATFRQSRFVPFGMGGILLWYPGAAHTPDNVVAWLPHERVLFGGCMVRSLGAKTMGNEADADMAAWPTTLQRLLTTFADAQVVIPGHGATGDTALLRHSIDLALARRAELMLDWSAHYRTHRDLASLRNVVASLPPNADTALVKHFLGEGIDMSVDLRYPVNDPPPPSRPEMPCAYGAVFSYQKDGTIGKGWVGEICE